MSFLSKLFGPAVPSIEAADVQAKLTQNLSRWCWMRELSECAAGHIAGSTLIPLHQLSGRLAELPKDCEIICAYALSGSRRPAARHLMSQGYTVLNLSAAWRVGCGPG
ncbi:MAG: hypothetical protein U0559_18640 [Anaerolineae bacterium]